MSEGSSKISSGEGKVGPLLSLQQAPQFWIHCQRGSLFLLPNPSPRPRLLLFVAEISMDSAGFWPRLMNFWVSVSGFRRGLLSADRTALKDGRATMPVRDMSLDATPALNYHLLLDNIRYKSTLK